MVSKCQNLKVTGYSADWADGVPAAGGGGQSEHHEEGGGHPLRIPLPDLHLPGAPLRHCATTPCCQWLCGVSGGARAVERGGRQPGGGGRAGLQRQEAAARHPPPRLLQPPARRGRAPAEAAKLTLRISSLEAVYIHRIYIYIYSTLILLHI